MDLPDPVVVMKGALPPIAAALLLVGTLGARLTAAAMAVGLFVAFWLLKERPAWPHELWVAPDGRQWLLWGVVAAAAAASLEHFRVLPGKVGAGVGVLVAAFSVWLMLQKVATQWQTQLVLAHVGGGAFLVAFVVLATRTSLARAPATIAPAVVFTVLLSALSVLLTIARSGLLGQMCGATAAALGAAAGTSLWRRPFALKAADGTWLGVTIGLMVLAGVHLATVPWSAAGCALVAPCALLLLRPSVAQRPWSWLGGALLLAGVPMAGAIWFALEANAATGY